MRDELLADQPTETPASSTLFTTSSAPTTLVAHSSTARTAPAPAPVTSVTVARSVVRNLSATYARARQLPMRRLFLIVLGAYMVLTAAVVFGSPLDVIDRAAAMSNLAHRFPHAPRWVLR